MSGKVALCGDGKTSTRSRLGRTLGDRGEAWVLQIAGTDWGSGSGDLRVLPRGLSLTQNIPQRTLTMPQLFRLRAHEVLHLLPLQHPRGKSVQLQSFDESYVERLRAGDFRTQEHFVAYFSELIQLKLRSRLHSPQAIEDVRQETFTRVFTALRGGKLRQPDRLGSFVNSMCNNVLLEQYRASSRDSSLEDEDQKDFPAHGVDVLGALAAKQIGEKIREILEELPERDRRLLREVFLEERDKDDVCRDFGVDRDYLRVLLHRAKLSFKSLYLKNIAARPPGVVVAEKL